MAKIRATFNLDTSALDEICKVVCGADECRNNGINNCGNNKGFFCNLKNVTIMPDGKCRSFELKEES